MLLQYLKLEELSEQSRLNQWQMDCRNSLLAIMLHHTVDHNTDPTNTIDQQDSQDTTVESTDCNFDSVSVRKGSRDSELGNKEETMELCWLLALNEMRCFWQICYLSVTHVGIVSPEFVVH